MFIKELAATNPNARMLEQAPLTIVVCGDMQKALEGKGRQLENVSYNEFGGERYEMLQQGKDAVPDKV